MDRIQKLCLYLDKCVSFADVGCDHGYCTKFMLDNNMCERAIISDISAKCLEKAETLLSEYMANGRVRSVCCSGLTGIDKDTQQVLIAGMGGEEIISILKSSFIPEKFVLQPMKNVKSVREYLLKNGAAIYTDEAFEYGGKYYYVLKGARGEGQRQTYSRVQFEYGLNLHCEGTRGYLESELLKKRGYLERPLNDNARAEISEEIQTITEILRDEFK